MSESNSVVIVDTTISIIEYKGHRVVTLAMIDKLHRRTDGTAKRNFSKNKSRFIEGKHFYLVDSTQKYEFRTFNIEIPRRGLTLITERGYSMLVKSFSDDFAWDVQEQLSDSYFDNSKSMSTAEFLVHQAGLMLKYEQRMKRVEDHQIDTDIKIAETRQDVREIGDKANKAFEAASAALQHKFGKTDYYTIMAYASISDVNLDLALAKVYGGRAGQLSRQRSVQIIKVPDERFGKVNSYHESILKDVFAQLGSS